MPGELKVTKNCHLRVFLTRTKNKECPRCGNFYLRPKIDQFDFGSASEICDGCNVIEGESSSGFQF